MLYQSDYSNGFDLSDENATIKAFNSKFGAHSAIFSLRFSEEKLEGSEITVEKVGDDAENEIISRLEGVQQNESTIVTSTEITIKPLVPLVYPAKFSKSENVKGDKKTEEEESDKEKGEAEKGVSLNNPFFRHVEPIADFILQRLESADLKDVLELVSKLLNLSYADWDTTPQTSDIPLDQLAQRSSTALTYYEAVSCLILSKDWFAQFYEQKAKLVQSFDGSDQNLLLFVGAVKINGKLVCEYFNEREDAPSKVTSSSSNQIVAQGNEQEQLQFNKITRSRERLQTVSKQIGSNFFQWAPTHFPRLNFDSSEEHELSDWHRLCSLLYDREKKADLLRPIDLGYEASLMRLQVSWKANFPEKAEALKIQKIGDNDLFKGQEFVLNDDGGDKLKETSEEVSDQPNIKLENELSLWIAEQTVIQLLSQPNVTYQQLIDLHKEAQHYDRDELVTVIKRVAVERLETEYNTFDTGSNSISSSSSSSSSASYSKKPTIEDLRATSKLLKDSMFPQSSASSDQGNSNQRFTDINSKIDSWQPKVSELPVTVFPPPPTPTITTNESAPLIAKEKTEESCCNSCVML